MARSQHAREVIKFDQGDIPAEDKTICPECNTLLGASNYTNQAHKENCELREEMRADREAFQQKYECTIMPDGAEDALAGAEVQDRLACHSSRQHGHHLPTRHPYKPSPRRSP